MSEHKDPIDEARRRLETVRASINDNEAAHAYENDLHIFVLRAIHAGQADPQMLAYIALQTLELDFKRCIRRRLRL